MRESTKPEWQPPHSLMAELPQEVEPRVGLTAILLFIAPALSTVLADPVMGLVDVLCLGQGASTLDLAALGPNLTVFNFISYAFLFLGAVTMIKTSEAYSRNDAREAEGIICGALSVAVVSGLLLAAGLIAAPQAILGATGALPVLLPLAAKYAMVRAVSLPAALATMVLQSGLLAQKDTRTPLKAIGAAVLFNVLGDYLLVNVFGLGLLGSAYATSAGVWIGLVLLAKLGFHREREVQLRWHTPSKAFWRHFFGAALPLAVFSMVTNACFFLIQASATQLDLLSNAAHQSVWAVWSVCAMASFPLQQAAQVFLSEELSLRGPGERSRELVALILKVAVIAGLGLGSMCAFLAAASPGMLARDASLWPLMTTTAPFAFFSLLFTPCAQALDGVLMTMGDSSFLANAQVFNLLCMAGFLWTVAKTGRGISCLWASLAVSYAARVLQGTARLAARRGQSSKLGVVPCETTLA